MWASSPRGPACFYLKAVTETWAGTSRPSPQVLENSHWGVIDRGAPPCPNPVPYCPAVASTPLTASLPRSATRSRCRLTAAGTESTSHPPTGSGNAAPSQTFTSARTRPRQLSRSLRPSSPPRPRTSPGNRGRQGADGALRPQRFQRRRKGGKRTEGRGACAVTQPTRARPPSRADGQGSASCGFGVKAAETSPAFMGVYCIQNKWL